MTTVRFQTSWTIDLRVERAGPSVLPSRKTLAHLAWREGGLPMAAIAQRLGVTDWAVSKMIRASRDLEISDRNYRRAIESIRSQFEKTLIDVGSASVRSTLLS